MAKRRMRDKRVAVAYIRVSTKEQHIGPEAQRAAIEQWAAREGVQIASWHVDKGLSGSKDIEDRPGLVEAIAVLQLSDAGHLVAARRDRFARKVGVASDLRDRLTLLGVSMTSAAGEGSTDDNEDPDAVLQSGMHDLLAEHYRLLVKSRTRAALRVKKAKGERVGSVPYGKRLADDMSTLVDDPAEQATLELIRRLRAAGTPLRAIVETLTREGVPPRGQRWHLTTVSRLLAA